MNLPDGVKHNLAPIILAILGIGLLIIGGIQLVSRLGNSTSDVVFEEPSGVPSVSPEKIKVDIEGAVTHPGVYELTSEMRLVEAIAKAGGLSEEADRDYVQKHINLAQKVSDGVKFYIPRVGEQVLTSANASGSSSSSSVININTGSEKDLDSLPGVGSVTAGKIIAGRPYENIDELLSKKIVSQSVFDKIKDQIAAN